MSFFTESEMFDMLFIERTSLNDFIEEVRAEAAETSSSKYNADIIAAALNRELIDSEIEATAKEYSDKTDPETVDILKAELLNSLMIKIDVMSKTKRLPYDAELSEIPACLEKPFMTEKEARELYAANLNELIPIIDEITDKATEDFSDNEIIDCVIPYEIPECAIHAIRYSQLSPIDAVKSGLYREINLQLSLGACASARPNENFHFRSV
jgi:hypothetical protein